jgi:hypothetical protein
MAGIASDLYSAEVIMTHLLGHEGLSQWLKIQEDWRIRGRGWLSNEVTVIAKIYVDRGALQRGKTGNVNHEET